MQCRGAPVMFLRFFEGLRTAGVPVSLREYLGFLEGMAAGQCVVIPADGAYWDRVLEHGVNCVKYKPDDADSLARVIEVLSRNLEVVERIGNNGRELARTYSDHRAYANIRDVMRSFARMPVSGQAATAR